MARGSPADVADGVKRFFDLSLLGLVASGYLAVLGSAYLDAPTATLVGAALLLRALIVAGLVRLPASDRIVAALALAYIGFFPVDYLFVSRDFPAAAVHLVFFLAALKVLTAHTSRDHVFVAVIAFLELLSAAVLSANLNFFVFLALFLVFGVAAFASSEVRRSIRKGHHLARGGWKNLAWRLTALTLGVSFGILALTGGLFFLLPRTAQAAFRRFAPQGGRVPGFANEMTLGDVGRIRMNRSAVMHVRFFDTEQPADLKWRGAVLSQFDGRRWYNPADAGRALPVTDGLIRLGERTRGEGLRYEVQLNPIASDALFFAGEPVMVRVNAPALIRTATDSLRMGEDHVEGLHYGAYSVLRETDPDPAVQPLGEYERNAYLLLPALDHRIVALARDLTRGQTSDAMRARALESYLRDNFDYSIDALPQEVPDPLASFMFERRKGYCEYFASAMAVMLRAVNIPSRVATGFQSGVYNPVSGWLILRSSDAHSWVEAWLPERGWTTFDPTPADPTPPSNPLFSRLGFYLDAADTFWQEWVLNYDLDRQLTLAAQMESSGRSFGSEWAGHVRLAAKGAGTTALRWGRRYGPVLFLMVVVWMLFPRVFGWVTTRVRVHQVQHGEARASDATLLYGRMLSALRRRGFEKPDWVTPGEFARMLPASEMALQVTSFTKAYHELRFGGAREAAPRMMQALDALERG